MPTGRYAEGTKTSPESSRLELDRLLRRYKAGEIIIGHDREHRRAAVEFTMQGRRVRMSLEVPPLESFRCGKARSPYGYAPRRTDAQARKAQEAEEWRLWRVLILRIKSRLEAIASESETFDSAFLAYLVLPYGDTVADVALPVLGRIYESGELRNRLLMPPREE